ncbi:zinc finger MYM-type protein 1-like isoform X3 [Gadus morhua]|nr:zinc finger MYM-type protein 1-like isoform X3 [Gadus morhua]
MHCFSCRNFMNEERFQSRTGWKSVGINLWRQAKVKIKEHRSSELHMLSMIRWNAFKKDTLQKAFAVADSQMEAAKERERQKNRAIMFRLMDITLFLAKQALAFRGNEEGLSSSNRGNFLNLVDLLGQYDSVLGLHLDVVKEKQTSNQRCQVSLLSNRTQNDLIKALSVYVKRIIQKEVTEASQFSILLDETTDVSHIEQVSFVVRYVHNMTIKERFVQLCDVASTTGEALENVVMKLLEQNNLNIQDVCGQGYDGAANMSGRYNGLQSRIQKQNERALYVHCHAHCLNLILVESAKSNKHFVDFFTVVERLYTFIANSTKRHAAFVATQKAMNPDQRVLELQRLSDTRWSWREDALKTIRKVLPAALQYLRDLRECDPPDLAAGEAKMLLSSIDFEFLLCLEIAMPVFMETSVASKVLQQDDLDLAAAYSVLDGVLKRVVELRRDSQFSQIYNTATTIAEENDINIPTKIPGRRRKVPAKLKYTSQSAREDDEVQTLEEYYRGRTYDTFLDRLRQELERRFYGEGKTRDIVMSLQRLIDPEQWKDIDQGLDTAHSQCEFYGLQGEDTNLQTELRVFHASYKCPKRTVKSTLEIFKEHDAHIIFPTLFKLIKIYATLPVSTATVERSFSKLKLVKTRLRNQCGQERLSDLLLLSIEKDIPINKEEVLKIFIEMAPTRRLLL